MAAAVFMQPTVWGGNLFPGFCNMFSESSPLLALAAWQLQPKACGTLRKNILQNLRNKLPPQNVEQEGNGPIYLRRQGV